ncbi:hypothetical protein [Planktothrix sp. FACHB-1365]|uniref:hypothetical protein n=1 Tax=Planktothrix sp. FACHB-1365 TaxID=2692855 RepID=UPI0016899D0E|nr:hypothetical protein [Planktothrix sp. FACHB-1365]MBD2481555.1 hypothetical protein [Planktothrix sp. FACHB-1365]
MTVVQIEERKIEFLVPIGVPIPEYRIGQLVAVLLVKDWETPDNKCWFPAMVTGMAWLQYRDEFYWEYQVKFLNCDGDPFEWFSSSEMWLLEDC